MSANICYLDSSVIIRWLFDEEDRWKPSKNSIFISSEITRVECLRTVYRYNIINELHESQLEELLLALHAVMDEISLIEIHRSILNRAGGPFSSVLGTLDAIHLSSAIKWQEIEGQPINLVTHDQQLARAARMLGLHVSGVSKD